MWASSIGSEGHILQAAYAKVVLHVWKHITALLDVTLRCQLLFSLTALQCCPGG